MTTFDFTPLYRSAIGFDHLASLLDTVTANDRSQSSYPPYNIERVEKDKYRITMAVAGFTEDELNVETENHTLTVSGRKEDKEEDNGRFLHRGIATRSFQRQFKLEEHVKVVSANMENGLLHVYLEREIPEAMKPRKISIGSGQQDRQLLQSSPKAERAEEADKAESGNARSK